MTLESASYISQIIIAVAALCALRQITVAKDDIKIRSKREAIKLSVDRIKYFLGDGIGLINEVGGERSSAGIIIEPIQINDFTLLDRRCNSPKAITQLREQIKKIKTDDKFGRVLMSAKTVYAANALEAFAVSFVSGVADENVAFSSIAHTYCSFVEENCLFYVLARNMEVEPSYYKNTIELYGIWSKRIEREKAIREKKEMSKKLDLLEAKLNEQNPGINPLGTV